MIDLLLFRMPSNSFTIIDLINVNIDSLRALISEIVFMAPRECGHNNFML